MLKALRKGLIAAVLFLLLAPTVIIALYRYADPPFTPLMAIRLIEGEGWDKTWVPLARMSANLPKAVIASEDNLFCRHFGFDWQALKGQIGRLLDGERPRGASTITMQTAKNILLWPDRDPLRKVFEAWLTPQIELLWSKQRILEVYLNVAETGPGVYGAEAAAQTYFGVGAAEISRGQAALIAAVLPNPRELSVASPSAYVRHRAGVITHRIGQLGPLLECIEE